MSSFYFIFGFAAGAVFMVVMTAWVVPFGIALWDDYKSHQMHDPPS